MFESVNPWIAYAVAVLVGYGIGSIPFGLLLTRAAGLGDVRSIGSGNIGATTCCARATRSSRPQPCCSTF